LALNNNQSLISLNPVWYGIQRPSYVYNTVCSPKNEFVYPFNNVI